MSSKVVIYDWGNIEWRSMYRMFANVEKVIITDEVVNTPNLKIVSNLSEMFMGTKLFHSSHRNVFNSWNLSSVTNISRMFNDTQVHGPLDISSWDVSSVKAISYYQTTFYDAISQERLPKFNPSIFCGTKWCDVNYHDRIPFGMDYFE